MTSAFQAHEALRDAILVAFVDPADHASITHLAYSEQPQFYSPGSASYEGGLYAWERAALKVMDIGPDTPVLLGAAGGGRELLALMAMGCPVLAFEPDPRLVEVARREADGLPSVTVHCASYADFVDEAACGSGPLVEFARTARAVILGWGSFPHLTLDTERAALLSALRSAAPEASVLLSFPVRFGQHEGMGSRRVRLARVLELIGGRAPPPGLAYIRRRGFVQRLLPEDIHDLAERTGYRVVVLEHSPYGHAVLVPH